MKEWVACIQPDSLLVEKIIAKLSLTQCYITHWVLISRSRDKIVECQGCISTDHINQDGKCILKIGTLKLSTITVSKSKGKSPKVTSPKYIITYPLYNILKLQQCNPICQERRMSCLAVVNHWRSSS